MALSCVTLASAGCSLLLSTSDLSEQAGGADGGGPPIVTEAGIDASAPSDGGTDALVIPPDANARFCETLSPAPKFCADFDGTGPVHEGWGNVLIDPDNVGVVVRDALGRDRSSLLAKLTAPQACSYARPTKTFPTTGFGLRVSFSFRPSSPWTNDAVFSLMNAEEGDCGVLFHFDGVTARVHFQYGADANDFFDWNAAPKLDAWSKIESAIDLDGNLTIALDGKTVFTQLLPELCKPGTEVYFAPGFHCENAVHEARYDDVIVDYP